MKLTLNERAALATVRRAVDAKKDDVWVTSSGTSGRERLKVLGLTRDAILASAAAVNQHLRATASDRWLVAIPTYHVGGFAILARAHLAGARIDFAPAWSAEGFRAACEGFGTTLSSLVPTQVFDLVSAGLRSPEALRAIVVGGGALDPALYRAARRLGWPVLPSYGLTETASQVATAALGQTDDVYPDLAVLSHAEIALDDGRVLIRGASLAHARAVVNHEGQLSVADPREGGWLRTEDLAEWAGPGFLRPLGRLDEVVKVLGVLVPVPRVEAELRESTGSGPELVVLPRRDPRREHNFLAVTDGPRSLDELSEAIETYNATAPGPRRIDQLCWVPKIPRTALGKVQRRALLGQLGLEA